RWRSSSTRWRGCPAGSCSWRGPGAAPSASSPRASGNRPPTSGVHPQCAPAPRKEQTVFIDFEGIDGSGKTTLSNRLAERLRALGYPVVHAREKGELKSALARNVRELTRDARHLEMGARTEFFLNLARDAQQRE